MNSNNSILIVDDEEPIRDLISMRLGDRHTCVTADSTAQAMQLLNSRPFDLVLTDINMPGESGLVLCQFVGDKFPDTVVVVISGNVDPQSSIDGLKEGAFDYVIKPFNLAALGHTVERALKYQALLGFKRRHEEGLEDTATSQGGGQPGSLDDYVNQMFESLYRNYRSTFRGLAQALESRDVETEGHTDRVVAYSLRIGKEAGLRENDLPGLEHGALLHDIGMVGVPEAILLKPGPLTEDETLKMQEHVAHGLKITIGMEFLPGARPVVAQHHEKYDGSGYPDGLRGDAIHINARIFAVADAYDALTSDRPYRAAQSHATACAEIMANSGGQFDPAIVSAFARIPEAELAEIRRRAESGDYTADTVGEREIRSFILSLESKPDSVKKELTGVPSHVDLSCPDRDTLDRHSS